MCSLSPGRRSTFEFQYSILLLKVTQKEDDGRVGFPLYYGEHLSTLKGKERNIQQPFSRCFGSFGVNFCVSHIGNST